MDTTAIVIATFAGPLVAVLITVWLQNRDRDYQRRISIFREMMMYRRHHVSREWVGSLNLVPVEFFNETAVMDAFNRLLDVYSDPGWLGTDEQMRRCGENAEIAASQLLLRMATVLNINMRGLDLRRAYAPQGWASEQEETKNLRVAATNMMSGRWPMRVVIVDRVATEIPAGGVEPYEKPPGPGEPLV